MTEHEREARQIALLEAYERVLRDDGVAPPPGLDPGLAATARALAREFGAATPAPAAVPSPDFRAALRERLRAQAAGYATAPARTAPPSAIADKPTAGHPADAPRRAAFRQRDPATAAAPSAATMARGSLPPAQPAAPHRPAPRPLRMAVSTGLGWLGAALVILVVALAATLLLRGLPRHTPATQPTIPPAPSIVATLTALPAIPATAQPTASAVTATPRPAAPLWQPTGPLALPRAQHTATRLADGRVLVAGGYSLSDEGESGAEIYDPGTGRWAPTGPMGAARINHSALLLPDGQVLVAGGFNNSVNHNTTSVTGAERYDPVTGQWRPVAAPPTGMGITRSALLADGRALIVASPPVGTPPDNWTYPVLLYDPRVDRWSSLGTVDWGEVPAVVALADGRALLLGAAWQDNDGTTPALLLDPATGQRTLVPLPEARYAFSTTRLTDGSVLVAGGAGWSARENGQPVPLDTTLQFDPATTRWREGARLTVPRFSHAATLLADGRILLVGGNNLIEPTQPPTAELYDPQTSRWLAAGALASNTRAGFALAALADGRALVIGGDLGGPRSDFLATAELFTPPARTVATNAPATPTPAVRPATPIAGGVGDWSSPSAGLLFFGGRGYRRAILPLPDGSAPQAGAQVGATLLRWQSGGVFPAGMPIYAVAGQPAEEWLVIKDGAQLVVYRRDDDTTALLAGVQVVTGRIVGDGATVCPASGCPAATPQAQPGQVATANRLRIERALQGDLPAGAEIEVRQLGVPGDEGLPGQVAALRPGERVLLFLIPAQRQSIGDFAGGDYYWTGPGWVYGFIGETVVPIQGGVQLPLDRFEAAVRELFAAVTPRAPTDPVPTPRPVPTATIAPTAPRAPGSASPTPTPGH